MINYICIIFVIDIYSELREEFMKIQRDFKKKRKIAQGNNNNEYRRVRKLNHCGINLKFQYSHPYIFGKHNINSESK